MAIQSAIPVNFDAFFPRGAFVVGEVEPIVKWSDDGERQGQDLDKNSGHPLWQVRVIDADPDARKGQGEVTVKIASISEPQLPPELNGLPFRPTVFVEVFTWDFLTRSGLLLGPQVIDRPPSSGTGFTSFF